MLTAEERIINELRGMYSKRGFVPFKMSKFEEYDLYMKNKDFLMGGNIISFTDTDGSLLALKPDVTLSIIKNAKPQVGVKEKVYYSEHVYRPSGSTHKFKEIMQMGLECIGDVDGYDVCETITLAAQSLAVIDGDFVLDLSHMGLIGALLDEAEISVDGRRELIGYVSEKNAHQAEALLKTLGVSEEISSRILKLLSMRITLADAERSLSELVTTESGRAAVEEISTIARLLSGAGFQDRIFFDASVMSDMNYYNGIVFRGFISGVSEGVLSGGRYDSMMKKMGKDSSALGFAIYLDLLEGLGDKLDEFDVDVLLIYDEKLDTGKVFSRVNELVKAGYSVSAQKSVPEGMRYRTLERMEV